MIAAGAVIALTSLSSPALARGSLQSIVYGGLERTYHVHPPDNIPEKTRIPLVIVLHGANGNAEQIEYMSGMSAKAEAEGFIAAYPEGTGDTEERKYTWNARNCCGTALMDEVDDIGFIKTLINKLLKDYPIDPDRIYVAGFSNGAMLAYQLACDLSGTIAAIAPVAGALDADSCSPSSPVSVIAFHGTNDPKILYCGGVSSQPGVPQNYDQPVSYTVRFWVIHDDAKFVDVGPFKGNASIIRQRYSNPKNGAEVVLFTSVGGVHAWPYGESGLSATDEMWDFFKSHRKISK